MCVFLLLDSVKNLIFRVFLDWKPYFGSMQLFAINVFASHVIYLGLDKKCSLSQHGLNVVLGDASVSIFSS